MKIEERQEGKIKEWENKTKGKYGQLKEDRCILSN
jgi:hypothetical protein